jgi:photosystem II stability/assembly factor-like uncharacterized protein
MKPWLAKLLLGGLLATLLLATSIGPVLGATETSLFRISMDSVSSSGVVQSPNIRQIYMIDAANGWALGNMYLMRTSDGGITWVDVTPQGMTLNGVGASGYFLSANYGWLLTSLANNNLGTLFRTSDGGRTWTSFDVPFSNGQLQFLSTNTGYVMTSLGAGMSKQAVAIYQSTNGGSTWARTYVNDPTVIGAGTSLPLGGQKSGMAFRDLWRGWVGGNYPSAGYAYLYVTDNSGPAWSQVSLPLPSGSSTAFISIKAPIFFGPFNAIMPVSINGTSNDLYFYVTNDAGYKWVTTGSVRGGELSYTDFVTLNDGFVWDWAGIIHVTHNAGVNWTNVTPSRSFPDLRSMDFVSNTTGWIVEIHADGSTALYRTTDGGWTWNLLTSSQLLPTSSPSPSSTAVPVTDTFTPTNTLVPTATFTPVNTLESTATPTATTVPGATFTSTVPVGPTSTPTSTLQPTFTSSPTATLMPPPTFTAVATATIPASSGGIVQSPNIRQVYMIDTWSGWALGDTYLMRTTDGGQTWLNVTPQGMTLNGIGASGYFLTANYGWLLTNLANKDLGTLYRTADGGHTWTAFDVPFSGGQMQFLSTNTGFVMISLGAGMSKQAVAIYQTSNGGAAWTRRYVNDPTVTGSGSTLPLSGQKSGMTFRDIWLGWVGGNYPSTGYTYLYITENSGSTWRQVQLPLPSGYSSAFVSMKSPIFFGPFNAILPVSMVNSTTDSALYFYVTNDAGYKWVTTGLVRGGELAYTDFITLNDGFVCDRSGVFHVTHNAGVDWTTVTPNRSFPDLRSIDFVSNTTGWAVEIHADGSTSLYRTSDGARTWNLLTSSQPPVTPGPTFTPTATLVPPATFTPVATFTPTATLVPSATPVVSLTPTILPTPGGIVQSPNIRQMYMIDTWSGWALGDAYLLRTTDGGQTWLNVTPQGISLSGVGASTYFMTANYGWLLTGIANKDLGTLFRTADGGRTWTSFDVPFNGGQMQFLSTNTGFVMISLGAGMSKQAVAIYQTSNGGAAWTRRYVNDPTVTGAGSSLPLGGQKSGGMVFRDIWLGWVGGNYPSAGYTYLYITENSGSTWSQVSLPLPAGSSSAFISVKAPIFFGPFNAIMPVSINGTNKDLYFYVTNDAGYKWVITGSVRNGELPYTDFVTLNDGFVWDWSGVFHITHNAGVNWTTVTPNRNFPDLRGMDFVDKNTGWIVEIHADGSTSLYKTADGGRTWNLLTSSQPPATPSSSPIPGATFTPAATLVPTVTAGPTATLTTGPFGVVLVNPSDALNIRSGPSASYSIVGKFEYTETTVMRSGSTSGSGNNLWYQVQNPGGGTGWVNSYYLTEYIQPASFCSDTRIPLLLDRMKQAFNTSDGKLFASLVSPIHGLDVRLWHYTTPINYSTTGAADAFTSTTVQNWGAGPSTIDTIGTFASVIQPKMQDVVNAPAYATYCNIPKFASLFAEPWPGIYTNLNYYSLIKPGTPGIDFDYRQWMVGIEYVRGTPYLAAFIHIVWEP